MTHSMAAAYAHGEADRKRLGPEARSTDHVPAEFDAGCRRAWERGFKPCGVFHFDFFDALVRARLYAGVAP